MKTNKRKIIFPYCIVSFCLLFCKSADAQSLFNGKDISGWHFDVPDVEDKAEEKNPFIVRSGMLISLGSTQGHLITDQVYQNYKLEVEYKFPGEP